MTRIIDNLFMYLFQAIAFIKGYKFKKVTTPEQLEETNTLYKTDGFSFPAELQEKVKSYDRGTINFIAYYKNRPVGTVRLANPKIANRPFELYGIDAEGIHFEIQSLCVKKEYRDGSQLVMLGLFKEMYKYSVKHSIHSWSSCGMRNIYTTMRKYCKEITIINIDFRNIQNPLTQYLHNNNIIDTYFTMQVSSFDPSKIAVRFLRQLLKRWELFLFIFKIKIALYSRLAWHQK